MKSIHLCPILSSDSSLLPKGKVFNQRVRHVNEVLIVLDQRQKVRIENFFSKSPRTKSELYKQLKYNTCTAQIVLNLSLAGELRNSLNPMQYIG